MSEAIEGLPVERFVGARRAEFKVYAIYDSDIEAPGLFEIWSEKAVAEIVAAIWNKYEETNPFPGDTFPETDEETQRAGEWMENHPCRRIGYSAPFVVVELTVFGTMPRAVPKRSNAGFSRSEPKASESAGNQS